MINIKSDSRKIKPGDIFVALRGYNSDGHQYIEDAIKNGASKLIVMGDKNYSIDYELVKDSRIYLEDYLYENYSDILSKMNIIGITGTNGKTTTSYLIYQALNSLGLNCSYMGTVGYYNKSGKKYDLSNSTLDI